MVIGNLSEPHVEAMAILLEKGFRDSSWTKDTLQSTLALETTIALGVFNEDQMVVFLILQICLDEGEILLLVTDPLWRRQKIGSYLLKEAFKILKKNHIDTLFLDVSVENQSAISFYKSHGFLEVGLRKNYYSSQSNQTAIIMSRSFQTRDTSAINQVV